jgi:hypothetical protein
LIRHLLVIGAQRSGTSFLRALLDAHPAITMARPSHPEPKVFCDAELSAKGLGWYLDTFFAHAGEEQLLGDKSTSYLEDPEAPARASAMLGEAQVVVVLRDPVERAVSNWRFSTGNGLETRPVEEALTANLTEQALWDRRRTSVSPFAYLERGRYIDYLAPWFATFPETVHVVFLRELVEDPATVDGLWASLGVPPGSGTERPDARVNQNAGAPPALSDGLVGRLRGYFEPSDRALSSHLGRSLPWWGQS